MGANDSKRISSGAPALDVITTIQRRTAVPQLDPCLERLQQLRVVSVFFVSPFVFPPVHLLCICLQSFEELVF
jgi:hypothetical protein